MIISLIIGWMGQSRYKSYPGIFQPDLSIAKYLICMYLNTQFVNSIKAIHNHVITHNPRVSVSHSDHSTWHLHIKGVKEEDSGPYMAQINTDPMMSQVFF